MINKTLMPTLLRDLKQTYPTVNVQEVYTTTSGCFVDYYTSDGESRTADYFEFIQNIGT